MKQDHGWNRGGARRPIAALAIGIAMHGTAEARQEWTMLADPAAEGWSIERIDAAHAYAEEIGSCAVMLVDRGVVVAAFGDVARPLDLHSVRKSVLSTLYGPAVANGAVRLDATMDELGIDDTTPLTETERSATVEHLLTSRSGIYLPAAKETPSAKRSRPERGSAAPGERFHYNNWDFNVAGVVLERATERDLGALFRETLAAPLGMEDVGAETITYELEPRQSRHPAYAIRMSARDLARFGVLVANEGRVGEREVVPSGWLTESTRATSEFEGERGYGRMWWTYERGSLEGRLGEHRVIAGLGTGGQIVAVIPDTGVVFVHRGDTDNGRHVEGGKAWRLFEMLLAARDGDDPSRGSRATKPLEARPLAGLLPPPERPKEITLERAELERLVGHYRSDAAPPAELFLYDGRLFVTVRGTFEGELIASAPNRLHAKHGGSRIDVERDDSGSVTGLVVEAGGRTLTFERAH